MWQKFGYYSRFSSYITPKREKHKMKKKHKIKKVSTSSEPQDGLEGNDQIGFRTLIRERDPESSFILLIVPIILTFWVYYGKQADFDQLFKGFQSHWNQDFYSAIYEYLTAFLLMFWVPFFIVKTVFKKDLAEFGFQLGDARYGFRFVAIVLPFLLWAAYAGSAGTAIQTEYPLAKSTMRNLPLFLTVEAFYLIYYLAWEFLFRGFMLFGLEEQYGATTAILVQMIPSAIVHIGKPAGESFAAVFAGLIFGYLALRTRSIFYPFLLHAIVGVGTDVFVTLRLT
jgi:membrane protease YdiL (CAAX protease family)